MTTPNSEIILPLIALAEATLLIEKGRVNLPIVSDLLNDVEQDDRIEVYPLTFAIFVRSLTPDGLKIPELHDRFIVSTGLHFQDLGHKVAILTKDNSITAAGVLPVIW
jgi:PIN domain nuclease of toxin-antitoxin system